MLCGTCACIVEIANWLKSYNFWKTRTERYFNVYTAHRTLFQRLYSAQNVISTSIQRTERYFNVYTAYRTLFQRLYSAQNVISTSIQRTQRYFNVYTAYTTLFQRLYSAQNVISTSIQRTERYFNVYTAHTTLFQRLYSVHNVISTSIQRTERYFNVYATAYRTLRRRLNDAVKTDFKFDLKFINFYFENFYVFIQLENALRYYSVCVFVRLCVWVDIDGISVSICWVLMVHDKKTTSSETRNRNWISTKNNFF